MLRDAPVNNFDSQIDELFRTGKLVGPCVKAGQDQAMDGLHKICRVHDATQRGPEAHLGHGANLGFILFGQESEGFPVALASARYKALKILRSCRHKTLLTDASVLD